MPRARPEIAAFAGPQARTRSGSVRRRSADTEQERADLALQELIRVGGFDRSALVVAVPVGTGWMDPGAHDTLDFMLGGDVATVGVQYSYLTSVLSLLAHPNMGRPVPGAVRHDLCLLDPAAAGITGPSSISSG